MNEEELSSRSPAIESPQPVAPQERIELLDALRGVALFGILLMNMREFSGWGALPAADRSALTTPVDVVAELLHGWFFFHKFYSLFALLFGIGFAIQLSRMVARGADFRAVYLRRMAVLFVIGMVHMTLLYETDILALYAICGVILMPFRQRSDRTLLVWAIALIVLPVALRTMILLSNGAFDPAAPFWAVGNRISSRWGFPVGVAATHFVQTEGGWREFLLYNAANPPFRVASILERGFLFQALGTFLIGLWAGRRLMAGTLLDDTTLLQRVVRWGLIVGLPVNLPLAVMRWRGTPYDSPVRILYEATHAIGVTPLALAYAAGFVLLWRRLRWRKWLGLAAPAGRLALTNYLGQSVLSVLLFYNIGFGLAGTVRPARWALLTAALFTVQVVASRIWLSRFPYGPAEWVWRRITYGRVPR